MVEAPYDIRDVLFAEEKVLWSGRPIQGVLWTVHDFWKIPLFSLLVLIASLSFRKTYLFFVGQESIQIDIDVVLNILFTVLLVFCVFYLLALKFYALPRKRANTLYVVTSARVIVLSENYVLYLDNNTLFDLRIVVCNNGDGKIYFGLNRLNSNTDYIKRAPYFDFISNVQAVYVLILNAQRQIGRGIKNTRKRPVSSNLADVVKNNVAYNEKIIWSSPPVNKIIFRWWNFPLSMFGLVFLIISMLVFFTLGNLALNIIVIILILPHLSIGIYATFGVWLIDAWKRSVWTYYAITNNRIILVSRNFVATHITSISLITLDEMFIIKYRGNVGTIRFGMDVFSDSSDNYIAPKFRLIDNVEYVYNLIVNTKHSALETHKLRR